jgi:CHAT domain/Tetratricopeptide repeat
LGNTGLGTVDRAAMDKHSKLLGTFRALSKKSAARQPDNDPVRLTDQATDLIKAYHRSGQIPLLQQAIALYRRVLACTPYGHSAYAGCLSNLGGALQTLFERTGQIGLLTEAVEVGRAAVAATADGHPAQAGHLSNLGSALYTLFEHTGRIDDLTDAVDAHRAASAISDDHPSYGAILSNLGGALQALFEHTGQLALLTEAAEVGRKAVAAAPDDDPNRAGRLSTLSGALALLYEHTGDVAQLAEAVDIGRAAIAATLPDDPDRVMYLSNQGACLQMLSARTGQIDLLTEAVEVGRAAYEAIPEDHPARAGRLTNLANTLQSQFQRTGQLQPLTEAVEIQRSAVAATSADDPARAGRLSSLADVLRSLFDRTRQIHLLNEAVGIHRAAYEALPDHHPARPGRLSDVGVDLRLLFQHTGEIGLLNEAVDVHRAACAAAPEDHPGHAGLLADLGGSLGTLFEQTGQIELLTEAVEAGRAAVAATPEDHPDRARYLSGLGRSLQLLFEHTERADLHAEAGECHFQAANNQNATTLVRVQAYGKFAALLGSEPGEAARALAAVESAVALLPRLAPGELARGDREYQVGRLGQIGSFAALAAITALSAGDQDRAVELLEQTRGVLAADTIDARNSDLAPLRIIAPDLARSFEELREQRETLDRPAQPPSWDAAAYADFEADAALAARRANDAEQAWYRSRARARRAAQEQWEELIARIRAVDGFADFLQAPPVRELTRQACDGPIVFLVAGSARCDALILTGEPDIPIRTIRLGHLTEADVYDQVVRFLTARRAAAGRDLDPAQGVSDQAEILEVLAWLWDTVAEPVLNALGHISGPPPDGQWPRLWWCPVGIFSYLPIHAAGYHSDSASPGPAHRDHPRTVLDRVISSYAPTVRALAHARTQRPSTNRTVIVAVPDAPGTTVLTGVTSEARTLAALIPDATELPHPTRQSVLDALPAHPVAHFACHGHADQVNPADSRLILHDHRSTPLTVADINALHLTGALAYLSACDTTATSPNLADESVHLTGAFHLAGYQNVIGTLWPVHDHAAHHIAVDFYTHLTDNGTIPPDTSRAAHALHHATRKLRALHPETPTLWAAHTHTGT